jgi:excinuclease UvrABC ATPase subunit
MTTITELARHAGVDERTLIESRSREITDLRFIYFTILKEQGYSSVYIGKLFNKEHSTVLHGLRAASDMLQYSRAFANTYNKFYNKIMSKQQGIIKIEPPATGSRAETFVFSGYTCPVCNGRGGWRDDVGHDDDKYTECDNCDGTGKVMATITCSWSPNY